MTDQYYYELLLLCLALPVQYALTVTWAVTMSALWSALGHAVCSLYSLEDCNLCIRSTVMRDSVSVRAARQWTALIDHPHTYNLQSPTLAPSRSRVSNPSEPGRLGHLSALAADHGHGGDSATARPSAVSTIASAHCAQRVSLLSAKLELMIRVSPRPRIFGGEPSTSVCGSLDFLRICVRRQTRRPPSAHLWCRYDLTWPVSGCWQAAVLMRSTVTVRTWLGCLLMSSWFSSFCCLTF